ncbi:MAG: DUF4446 family protein [Candidatus Paceibacterota bacterium]|jgi:hypothetical protein
MFTIPQEIIIYIIAAILILVAVLIMWIVRLELKLKTLTRGQNGFNIESTLKSIESDLNNLFLFKEDIEKYLKKVEIRLRRSVQGVSIMSFKAFQGLDSGGHQSFASAFLDENGNGLIISTLHSRDRVNVFAKEIKQFASAVSLTEEEITALTQAKESCKL